MSHTPGSPEAEYYESRAPGWEIRCPKCGLKEPFGKYGIRKFAAGRKRILWRCPRCRRWGCAIIEKRAPRSTP
jgi:DNA-directed RNA polymerase subunit RPC12/RpoP